ncbi:MAG TPA: hypothetical protein VIK52_13470 [Opitutaceae bacterium]
MGNATWSGYELSIRQKLDEWEFMPSFLNGVEIWANHTRIYKMVGTFTGGASGPTITHLSTVVGSQINGGISYRSPHGKFYVHLKTNYQASRPTANLLANGGTANQRVPRQEAYQFWDGELTYRLTANLRLTVIARNLLSERPQFSEIGVIRNTQQDTGISWIFGFKYDL